MDTIDSISVGPQSTTFIHLPGPHRHSPECVTENPNPSRLAQRTSHPLAQAISLRPKSWLEQSLRLPALATAAGLQEAAIDAPVTVEASRRKTSISARPPRVLAKWSTNGERRTGGLTGLRVQVRAWSPLPADRCCRPRAESGQPDSQDAAVSCGAACQKAVHQVVAGGRAQSFAATCPCQRASCVLIHRQIRLPHDICDRTAHRTKYHPLKNTGLQTPMGKAH